MLCSLAWYNIGQENVENGKFFNGFIAFLMSGLINRWDLFSWLNATIIGFQIEEANSTLIYHVVNTAHYYCGEEYLHKLTQRINETSLPNKSELIELIDNLIEKPKARAKELRIIGDDGHFEVVTL